MCVVCPDVMKGIPTPVVSIPIHIKLNSIQVLNGIDSIKVVVIMWIFLGIMVRKEHRT